jgi:hypothetical protein
MLGKTVRLFIKALIIGVLINLGLQYVSATPLPTYENTALHRQAPGQVPLDAKMHTVNEAEE